MATLKWSIAEPHAVVLVVAPFCLMCVNKTYLYSPNIVKNHFVILLHNLELFVLWDQGFLYHSVVTHSVSRMW